MCNEHPTRRKTLGCQRNHARARNAPYVDAHAAQGSAREAQYPFDVVWHPASGHPEHGRLGEPELQDEAEALGADPAERRDGGGEGGLVGAEGAV
jgi:hypothetical protein